MTSFNLETPEEIQERVAKEAALRGNFKKAVPVDATYEFITTSQQLMDTPARGDKNGIGAGCPQIAVRVAPTDDGVPAMQFETTKWVILPLRNKDIENHKVDPKVTRDFVYFAQALAPERVQYVAAKLPDGSWDNTPETKALQAARDEAATQLAREIAAGTFTFEDARFFGDTKAAPKDKGGYYVNSVSSELQPGKKVVTPEEAEATN